MRSFDPNVWRKRAIRKHEKRLARGTVNSTLKLRNELRHIRSINKLVKWCQKQRLTVTFDKCPSVGLYEPSTRTITVERRLKPEHLVFILAHEVGHYLIGTRGTQCNRSSRGYREDTDKDRSIHYYVDMLEEEYEAWNRGRRQAIRLGIKFDLNNYNKFKVNAIKTYLVIAR